MAQLLSAAPAPPPDAATRPARRWPLPAVVLAAVVAPIGLAYVGRLWERPHYQFVPLAAVAAAYLLWRRWAATPTRPGRPAVTVGLLAGAWLALAAAVAVHLLTATGAGLVLLFVAVGYAAGGGRLLAAAWPAVALACLCVPPARLDYELVAELQAVTSAGGELVLNLFRVPILREGNVLTVGDRRLFVDEACSGVNSLFSTLACVLAYVGLTGRRWLPAVLLLAAAVGWVLFANVARVALIALGVGVWGIDLTGGWRHDAVGAATYLSALLLTLSTEQFLLFLGVRADAPSPAVPGAGAAPWPACGRRWVVASGAFGLLAAGYLVCYPNDLFDLRDRRPAATATAVAAANRLDRPDLPADGPGWAVEGFDAVHRNPGSDFGEYSRVWAGRAGRHRVAAAADYPFRGWHDLTECYTGQGWQILGDELTAVGDPAVPARRVTMTHLGTRSGLLLYAHLDEAGRPVPPPTAAPLWRRPGTPVARLFGVPDATPPLACVQVQVLVECDGAADAAAEQAAADLFRTLHRLVGAQLGSHTP